MNIFKTGFFILLKGYKNSNTFTNFYYNSYKDDFYIFISTKPLKAGFNKPNVLKGVIPKLNPHRLKDRQQSKVLKKINTGNNGFKDPSS